MNRFTQFAFLGFLAALVGLTEANAQGVVLSPSDAYYEIPTRYDRPSGTVDEVADAEPIDAEPIPLQPLSSAQFSADSIQSDETVDAITVFPTEALQVYGSMAPAIEQRIGEISLSELPSKIDLRKYLPTPGKQVRNDCVAWAVAYASYTCQICQERRRTPSLPSDKFSPGFIYNALGRGGIGLRVQDVASYLRIHGCASIGSMTANRQNAAIQPSAEAAAFRPTRHERALDLDDIRTYLFEGHPVILVVQMGEQFRDERLGTGDYNWSDSDRASGAKKAASYHAVTAVGYDDDRGSLLIMNSWGTEWKEDGFVWAQYDNFRSIGEGSWCEEAHVIGVKRVAPYNVVLEVPVRRRGPKAQPKKRRFSLKYDRKVYEFSDLISPEQWRFDDIAATENKLYVLRRNQAIYRMNDERNGTYSWTHLSTGPLANRKVTMLAAEDTSDLHALTDTNELFQLNERSGAWSKVNLPDRQSKPVDIRVVDGKMFATTSTGKAFIHSDQGSSWMLAQ